MSESSIGNYTIIRDIGEGGMARIYLASHRDVPSLRVILKVVSDPQLAERFRREAEKLAQLDGHPGICKIKHFFNHGRDFVIAMEYIDGMTLEERIEQHGPLPVGETLGIVDAVLDVLVFAHKRGIFHRDIKPSNIMIDTDSRVKVIDFGIAKGEADPTLTAVNAYLGTPSYMAPEQFRSSEDINYAYADIYAMGTTMYQMLTGELPYKETDLFLLRDAKMFQKPARPRKLRSSIPRDVEEIVLTAMEKEPEQRYPSVEIMRQAIQANNAFPGGARGTSPRIKKKRGSVKALAAAAVLAALAAAVFFTPLKDRVAGLIGADSPPDDSQITQPSGDVVQPPTAMAPEDGASFEAGNGITLRWSGSTGMAYVSVSTSSDFADVILNDSSTIGRLPVEQSGDPGTYFWRVSHRGDNDSLLHSQIRSFTIVDPSAVTGTVSLSINLPSDVYIDDQQVGQAVTELNRQVDTGRHVVAVINAGTSEGQLIDTIEVTVDETLSRSYQLSWKPVAVTMRGRPDGVRAGIDGGTARALPATVQLAPGRYRITASHPDIAEPLESTIEIQPGRDTSLAFDLGGEITAAAIASLRDSISRLDARIDGAERQEAPYLQILDWRGTVPNLIDTRRADSARTVLENVVTQYNDILRQRGERRTRAEQALNEFMAAFAAKDLAAMERLYPSMPDDEKKNWGTFFKAAERLTVDWTVGAFQSSGPSASADVDLTMSFTDRSGSRTENVPWRLSLAERSDGWVVTARDAR